MRVVRQKRAGKQFNPISDGRPRGRLFHRVNLWTNRGRRTLMATTSSLLLMTTEQIYNQPAMNSNYVAIYQGWRDEKGNHVLANHRTLRHVIYHSPSGFEWGYGGSGPADL